MIQNRRKLDFIFSCWTVQHFAFSWTVQYLLISLRINLMPDEKLDLNTLFTLRYLLDIKNDIVNLKQDVLDLQYFPERLDGSYKQEWLTYIKRQCHKREIELSQKTAQAFLGTLNEDQVSEYRALLTQVQQTENINNSENIKVIKTNVKAYIEHLLKL